MIRCTKCGHTGAVELNTKDRELRVTCPCGNTATYKKTGGRVIEMSTKANGEQP